MDFDLKESLIAAAAAFGTSLLVSAIYAITNSDAPNWSIRMLGVLVFWIVYVYVRLMERL